MFFFNLCIIYLLFNNKYPSPRWLKICESSNKKIKYPSPRWLKICESSKKYKNNN